MNGETRIGYGGTESIDTPSGYADVSKELLKDIGIDVERFYDYYDQDLYNSLNLSYAIAYDSETYGERKLVRGYGSRPWEEFAADTPMSERAKADLVRAFNAEVDYLPGMSREDKIDLLSKISYRTYLRDYVKVDEQVVEMYQRWGMSFWCVGMDEVPAIYILGYSDGGGLPGLEHTVKREGGRGSEPYIFHFPDGNASVARLLVRKLMPEALPGSTMEDSVMARLDYSRLDQEGADLSIRLNSTVVNAEHTADSRMCTVATPTPCGRSSASWPVTTVRFPICVRNCQRRSGRDWRTTSKLHSRTRR